MALDLLARAITSWPDHFELYMVMAGSYLKLRRFHAAVDATRAAISLRPDEPGLYSNLAIYLNNADRPAEAKEAALASIRLAPDQRSGLMWMAEALRLSGERGEALSYAERAVALDPSVGLHVLGRVLLLHERWLEAEETLRRAVATRPEFSDTHFYIALSLLPQARLTDAVESLETSLRRDFRGELARPLLDRVEEWLRTEALVRERTSDGRAPDRLEALRALAELLMAQDRLTEAADSLEALLADRPDHGDARQLLERLKERLRARDAGEAREIPALLVLERDLRKRLVDRREAEAADPPPLPRAA
jgi:tetratricopeptide (TPR) repeat protein